MFYFSRKKKYILYVDIDKKASLRLPVLNLILKKFIFFLKH